MKTQQKTCERCGELYYPNRSDGMRRAGEIRIQRFCSRICGQRSRRENNVRVRTMNPEQAAYLAGLFEGEGCIYYEPKSGLRLVLSNTDRALVDCLVIFTGIGVANYKKMRDNMRKDAWYWTAYSWNAVAVLRQLIPYMLGDKRSRAEQVIEQHHKRTIGRSMFDKVIGVLS